MILDLTVFLLNFINNFIGGVMVSELVSSEVDCGFEPRSGQTKDYTIGMCCFPPKHTSRRKGHGLLAWNRDNASEWATYLPAGCCFSELAL
jgi:hypothetical protein